MNEHGVFRVVIVGHGPSLQGKGLGPEINSFDAVVRMKRGVFLVNNNFRDYGTRCDYICASTEVPGCFMEATGRKDWNVREYWAYPKKGYYDEKPINGLRKELKAPIVVPLNLCNAWNETFRGIGGKHHNVSTGFAAVLIACDRLRPFEITLAGFDTLMNPQVPFSRAELPRTGFGPFPNHDWEKENELLTVLTNVYKVNIHAIEERKVAKGHQFQHTGASP